MRLLYCFIKPPTVDLSPSGVMSDEGFEQGGNLLLLAAGKLRSGLEKSTHLAGWTGSSSLSAVVVGVLRQNLILNDSVDFLASGLTLLA
jgi:hypothetical protein